MVYAQLIICFEEWHIQIPMGFLHKNGSTNIDQKTRTYNNQQKKKRTCKAMDFVVADDQRVKLK